MRCIYSVPKAISYSIDLTVIRFGKEDTNYENDHEKK